LNLVFKVRAGTEAELVFKVRGGTEAELGL